MHSIHRSSLIRFTLERKDVKHINLRVQPDGEVKVSAHPDVPYRYIEDFVEEKSDWILKQIKYFDEFRPRPMPEKEYLTGEGFRYLGRQYRLKVIETKSEEYVKLARGYINLYVNDKNDIVQKEKMISEWYKQRQALVFEKSLKRMWKLVKSFGVTYPILQTRKMKIRWGSCLIDDNTIILNNDLIYAPTRCIDYVILHELVHFIEKDHDEEFYRLMYLLMPDWEARKKYLDEEMVLKI